MAYIHHLQHSGQMIYELLCAGTDDYLILSADNTPGFVQISGYLRSEYRFALTVCL